MSLFAVALLQTDTLAGRFSFPLNLVLCATDVDNRGYRFQGQDSSDETCILSVVRLG